jgi:hypothetical protein
VKQQTIELKAVDLVLGDRVRLMDGPYGWATVVEMTGDMVKMVRPYVHVGDTEFGGVDDKRYVLNYLGTEEVNVCRVGERLYTADRYTHECMSQVGALK